MILDQYIHWRHWTIQSVYMVAALLALGFSLMCIFVFALAFTEIALVPWDTWDGSERPPLGTLPRTINDFFEGSPGAYLPAWIIMGGVVLMLGRALLQAKRIHALVIWRFVLTNLLFVGAVTLLLMVGTYVTSIVFNPVMTANDVGFHRTAIYLLGFVVLWAALIVTQFRIDQWKHKKKKRFRLS